ncbi:MAG: cell wall hydrolase [Oscillospiraceae bacterium]|nr:cell wall hydrolase [Oscillospiraceae bacterium]
MKKLLVSLLVVCLLVAVLPSAEALSLQVGSTAVSNISIYNSTTYVPIRTISLLLCPGASVTWENNQAVVRTSNLTVTARPGAYYINANGRMLYAADGVKLVNGTTLVPIRVIAKAMGASVTWNASAQKAIVTLGSGTIASGDQYYSSDAVYWLSRIINAESSGESLKGKIAVGNVILNRVASSDFPNSIYGVIFDKTGGTQFTPVANGTIYNAPSSDSILAAKLCLDGASVAGSSLFFLNPVTATSSWITKNRPYVTSVGNHAFYA